MARRLLPSQVENLLFPQRTPPPPTPTELGGATGILRVPQCCLLGAELCSPLACAEALTPKPPNVPVFGLILKEDPAWRWGLGGEDYI